LNPPRKASARQKIQEDDNVKKRQKLPALLWLALALQEPAVAQSELILPQNLDDISRLSKPADAGPCDKCGVVTDISSKQRELRQRRNAPVPGSPVMATTPIIGSGDVVKEGREPVTRSTSYVVTVRYDDGAYAFFEQDEKPTVRRGDRVQVSEGRVELR
jgi:hypothetical protein